MLARNNMTDMRLYSVGSPNRNSTDVVTAFVIIVITLPSPLGSQSDYSMEQLCCLRPCRQLPLRPWSLVLKES